VEDKKAEDVETSRTSESGSFGLLVGVAGGKETDGCAVGCTDGCTEGLAEVVGDVVGAAVGEFGWAHSIESKVSQVKAMVSGFISASIFAGTCAMNSQRARL
jgi:hypothetical protein